MGGDDDDIFRNAMRGVRPLRKRTQLPQTPRPRAAARYASEERRAMVLASLETPEVPTQLELGDAISFARPGTSAATLRKLRRGQYAVQAAIDLHGLRREAAHDALREFIGRAAARGLRCVRVVHGKGLRSGPGGPVIKLVVDRWLRRMQPVVAFVSARTVDGGTGAVYVLLSCHARSNG